MRNPRVAFEKFLVVPAGRLPTSCRTRTEQEEHMILESENVEVLPWVKGELNYLAPGDERPRTYTYEPPGGVPRSTVVNEPHTVQISDARPILAKVSLDEQGFGLVRQRSAVRDFY